MSIDKTLDRLIRASIGYDPLFNLAESTAFQDSQGYPPYNIEKTGDDTYRITLALAGIRPEDLQLQVHRGLLTIEFHSDDSKVPPERFLHRGIAKRPFSRQFRLAEHVEVVEAQMDHGLLHIDLMRVVPEDQKPRAIPVRLGTSGFSALGGGKAAT